MTTAKIQILDIKARDIRFPTSLGLHGSDALHKDPDYSMAYITITTNYENIKGYGLSFTLGRGTEIIVTAISSLAYLFKGRHLNEITANFGEFWHDIVQESQLRWLGPEKGVTHMAIGGIFNAIWDLWGRVERKPVWKLLVDMEPEQIINLIDFHYISDFLTKEEALEILRSGKEDQEHREKEMVECGFPAYTTSAGWLGYSDSQIQSLCKEAMDNGFRRFKMKVGGNLEDDKRRIKLLRDLVGDEIPLMTDANQRWSTSEAVAWMKELAPYNPYWIEEPTHPDDVLAHAEIRKALEPYGILVATGEHCANRVLFKQFFQARGMEVCQIDACRLGSVNECLAVILMAAKAKVPVCPHAGGVGLCEYVQHFSFFDYICVSKSLKDRMCEYADHLHEHFIAPAVIKNGCYQVPMAPGYSAEVYEKSLTDYEYPHGTAWQRLIAEGKVPRPTIE